MLAPATLETVLELAAEAGRLEDAARTRLGIGGDVASTTATTLEMADAVAAFHFPDDVWARVIYDMIIAARDPQPSLEALVASLVPIYFGRVASFVIENRTVTTDQAEERVERQAREFELLKPYLVKRWNEAEAAGSGPLMARPPLPARILIPVANPMTAEELIRLGAAMLDRRAGELSALGIVEVPEGMPLSEGATRARHARRLLQRVLDYAPDGTTIHPIVRIGRHAAEGIIEASAEQEADLIIFGWGGRAAGGRDGSGPTVFSPTIDEVVRDSPCDIAVVKQRGSKTIQRVLVPVRGGPHAELALRFADAIAIHHDATVVVLHLVPPGVTLAVRAQAERALAAFIKQHITGRSEAVLREAPNVRNAILREAEKADLVVMGASASPGGADGESYLFGALPEAIAARAKPTVMVVKTRESIERTTFDQLAARAETLAAADRAAEEARAVPVRVERWFGESNFHHAEFADLRRLVTLKEKQKLTISLVLPTLNEEETIGPIVRRAMREMVGRVPLLDEVLVIDSASTDRTREIAEAEGARVVQHPDVLARYGSFVGKGESLWKSVYEIDRRHHRLGRHRREELAPPDGLRDARAAPPRAAAPVRQGLLPAPDRRGRRAQGGRRRPRHRARRAAAHQPVLPGAVGDDPAAVGRVRRPADAARGDPVLHRLRGRDRPPHRHRRAARHRGPRPGRPGAADPPQPGARGPVADVVRHPPGGDEAASRSGARRACSPRWARP